MSVSAWASCSSTDDPIGFNYPTHVNSAGAGGAPAEPGAPGGAAGAPAGAAAGDGSFERTYPNLFGDLLGKTDDEITRKLDADFEQLFHGDPATEAIYVSVGADQAYVWDPRQMDIRSDGFANALLVSVELDRREEFDALWRFADAHLVLRTGPLRDYLRSRCDVGGDACDETVTAEPHFAATTALWLAHGRWGSNGELSYRAEAERLMSAVFRSEAGGATTLGELSGLVEPTRSLPLPTPYASTSTQTTSTVMTAAYFSLWAEKSSDARAATLAQNARAFLASVTNAKTGLMPDHPALDGTVAAGEDEFSANSYPVPLAIALDSVWFTASSWHEAEANRLLDFFRAPLATQSYAATYTVSGAPGAPLGDVLSLQAPLSACAVASTAAFRTEFVQAAWDAQLNTGTSRKFGNLLYLLSSLLLSGRLRVY
ncbi:MAG TPA: glycosyl hydrolase family 8 [Polyangiaceae bacterium]|nr:glycosyl hydrolase family 8 [Polyangiaceae bacterium]